MTSNQSEISALQAALVERARFRLIAVLILILLSVAGQLTATAQSPLDIEYKFTDNLDLDINGSLVPSTMFQSVRGLPSILILSDDLDAPLLLDLTEQTARKADAEKLSGEPRTGLVLADGATVDDYGAFDLSEDIVKLTVGGKEITIKQRPFLLGLQEAQDLKAYSLRYVYGSEDFELDAGILDTLRQTQDEVRVRIYFGSWCPHCQQHVPALVRLADELKGSAIDFEFYGLPPGFGEEPEAAANDIGAVPTGVVYISGQESGRMSSGWEHPEGVLLDIIDGSS